MYTLHKILSRVYLGDYEAASDLVLLKHHGITHILVVGDGLSQKFPDHFSYMQLSIYDLNSSNLLEHFDRCNEFIRQSIENKGKVLIHCDTGISRAPTIAIAYVMASKHFSFAHALEFLKKKHPETQPNNNFVTQLNQYQAKLLKQSGFDIVKNEVCGCSIF
ncbi:unnamed protein product [Blepharisma stoltei]|uniref:Dual specificity protein phosphatase n=1 Tax=Blepharisma stoltei TaxID=1481888 RepID=A0AAU9JS68_9CILI|nr:unnamed protein product [Blepharisma stoltei]